jgi:O-antigen/teichoic acid export membrane protein
MLALALVLLADVLALRLFREPALAPLIRWMALCLLAANLSTIALARLQSAERFTAHSLLRIVANGLKVVMLGGLFLVGWLSPQWATIAWALSFVGAYAAGTLVCRGIRAAAQAAPGDRPYREIMTFAGWVMVSGVMFAIHLRTDVLLLGHYGTAEDVGNYAVAWNLMLLMDLVTSSLIVALMPRVARATNVHEVASLRRRTLLTGAAVTMLMLPLYFFAEPLLHVLFPAFPHAVAPFRLLFWSSVVVLLVYPLYLGFYAQNRPGKVTFAYAALSASSLGIGLVLIPFHGAMGAAWTTLAARVIGAIAILAMLGVELRAASHRTAAGS